MQILCCSFTPHVERRNYHLYCFGNKSHENPVKLKCKWKIKLQESSPREVRFCRLNFEAVLSSGAIGKEKLCDSSI